MSPVFPYEDILQLNNFSNDGIARLPSMVAPVFPRAPEYLYSIRAQEGLFLNALDRDLFSQLR
jgi:hypothetical protein